MVGEKVVLRTRMSAGDAHYAGELVEGAHIVTAWGDVGTEEYSGWIEKVGNTSLTCHFEAHKVIELARGEKDGLADSAANVLPEPILCAYGTGTLVVKKQYQRVEFADPKFQNH